MTVPALVKAASLERNPALDSWVRIDESQTVTLFTGKVELGQWVKSAIARIGAEELELSLERVVVRTADTGSGGPDEGRTSGSSSMKDSGTAMRYAAAAARAHLLRLAAERLGEDVELLQLDDGRISSRESGASTTYWELLGGGRFGVDVDLSGAVAPRSPESYRILGRPGRRIDMLGLVTGTTRFVQDLALPGMLHARVVRPPSPAARLESVDLARVTALPGVCAVVHDGSFLGVVAEREDQAVKARESLAARARWDEPETLPPNDDMPAFVRSQEPRSWLLTDGLPGPGPIEHSEPPADAALTLQRTFTRPMQMHGSIGPSAAAAQWDEDGALTVWSHSQGVGILRDCLADVLELGPERVRVIHVVGPGCYGHNGADDVALDAALLARAVPGRPVLAKWTRADEHLWEPYGPAMTIEVRASLDGEGRLIDWSSDVWSNTHNTRPFRSEGTSGLLAAWHLERPWPRTPVVPSLNLPGGVHRNANPYYRVDRRRVVKRLVEAQPVRTSAMRALGGYANVFAIESMIDDLADAAGRDPLEFRLAHLDDERAREVLQALAELAGWHERPREFGRGAGIGFARYKNSDCYAAVLVELSVDDATSQIKLERAAFAADAGQIVDPDGLANQLEGGVIQSASWTLKERVHFDRTRLTSADWEAYPILTFPEVPEVEHVLIDRPGMPFLGAGEATQGPTAAAIGNAVFDAIGLRLLDIPFTPERIQAAALG
jgi:nicotinate dehydrogenase subunit B